MISGRDAVVDVKTLLGCVSRNGAGSAGAAPGHRQPWSSLYYVRFWLLIGRVVKFRLIWKEWRIGIGV